jgi:transcriptional regulator with XRE-family HTH domain
MEPKDLVEALIAIIGQIQTDSELECPPLTGATKPAGTVPEFDSKIWPVATTILATEINIPIPDAAFDRGNRGVRVRAPEEAGQKASSSMTDQDSVTRSQIAERLKEARKLAGLSQGHVARMLGLHRPSVSEIEAGNRRVSADELAKLAALYDVSVAWLLREVSDSVDAEDPRLELAARELSKLKPEDLQRLLNLLAVMRNDKDEGSGG